MHSLDTDVISRRWLILAAVISVLIMAPLDGSALNVALPSIKTEFALSLGVTAWVPLIYLLVIGSMILPMGRLGDLWGFRRIYLLGIVIFTVSSLLCGLSPNLPTLIAMRAVQGFGACMLMALSSGIITAIFPPRERGRALGMMGMGIALGLVLGPTLGGILIDLGNWRWIFFINVPIGFIGLFWCRRMLPTLAPSQRQAVDWYGALLIVLTLGTLLLAVTRGTDWGWSSPLILSLFTASVVGATGFAIVERRHIQPMLDFTLFAHPVFTGANIAIMMNYLGQFCALFLIPLLLQQAWGYDPRRTGLMMGILPVCIFVFAPVSGFLSDKLGTRALATAGELIVAMGLLVAAFALTDRQTPHLILALLLIGIGSGLFQSPNNSAVMGSVPRTHLGIGGGVLATMRNLGMAFGIAISSAVAEAGRQHYLLAHPDMSTPALVYGIRAAFLVGAIFVTLGAITSAVRADQRVAK